MSTRFDELLPWELAVLRQALEIYQRDHSGTFNQRDRDDLAALVIELRGVLREKVDTFTKKL